MAITGDTRPDDQWADDETESMDTEPMDDDPLFVEFDADDETSEVRAEAQARIPNWRLIEDIREAKNLKWALADFEDYEFENFAG